MNLTPCPPLLAGEGEAEVEVLIGVSFSLTERVARLRARRNDGQKRPASNTGQRVSYRAGAAYAILWEVRFTFTYT